VSSVADDFSQNLKAQRERRGLTQASLGRRADMSAAMISHFETGQRSPSLESLVKLADALDSSVDMLLGRQGRGASVKLDPIFSRASRAPSNTLDMLKRVTEALLADVTDEDESGSEASNSA
jgi:transcriptional regulator with XRE-family HTH domain